MTSPSSILVTGGAGFIGGVLATRLAADGHRVAILDFPEYTANANLPPAIERIGADLASPETYERNGPLGNRRFAIVCHLGAQSSARVSHEQLVRSLQSNSQGTLLLAEWARESGVQHVLFASSMAVYGPSHGSAMDEGFPTKPASYYGLSKLDGEHILRIAGVPHTTFRLFNVYGPGQNMANLKQGMASIYLSYVIQGVPVPVTGSLNRSRDLIYIDDVVDAWCRAIESPAVSIGQTWNVCSGRETTVRELLDTIISACGNDPASYPVNEVVSHSGDVDRSLGDSTCLQKALGWQAQVGLEEGISRMARWARHHSQQELQKDRHV